MELLSKKELMLLSKRANSRLRNLENKNLQHSSNAYKHIEMLSQNNKIFSKTRKGEIKFSTNYTQLEKDGLLEEFQETVSKFLESKTSTKIGIDAKYKQGYETFKKEFYADVSYDDYINSVRNFTKQVYWNNLSSSSKQVFLSSSLSDKEIDIVNKHLNESYNKSALDFNKAIFDVYAGLKSGNKDRIINDIRDKTKREEKYRKRQEKQRKRESKRKRKKRKR